MAMNAGRVALYFVGIALVVLALGIFVVQTGLSQWVPVSLLAAGVLLIIGLAVMSFADTAPSETPAERRSSHVHEDKEGDLTIVQK